MLLAQQAGLLGGGGAGRSVAGGGQSVAGGGPALQEETEPLISDRGDRPTDPMTAAAEAEEVSQRVNV